MGLVIFSSLIQRYTGHLCSCCSKRGFGFIFPNNIGKCNPINTKVSSVEFQAWVASSQEIDHLTNITALDQCKEQIV